MTSTLGKFTIDCFKVLHIASKQRKVMICRKNIFIGRGQFGRLYFAFLSLIYLIVFGKVVQNSRARCLFFLFLNFSMPMDNQINQYKTKTVYRASGKVGKIFRTKTLVALY